MTNLIRSNFQAHPFHLVSPSPWPLFTCIALLTLTTAGKPWDTPALNQAICWDILYYSAEIGQSAGNLLSLNFSGIFRDNTLEFFCCIIPLIVKKPSTDPSLETNITTSYKSVRQAAEALKVSQSSLFYHINRKNENININSYRNRYVVYIKRGYHSYPATFYSKRRLTLPWRPRGLRKYSSQSNHNKPDLFAYYLAGLIEAQNSAIIVPTSERSKKGQLNYPSIKITFDSWDIPLSLLLQKELSAGSLSKKKGANAYVLTFNSRESILLIVSLINGKMRTPKIQTLYTLIDWLNLGQNSDSSTGGLDIKHPAAETIVKLPLNSEPLDSSPWLAGFIEGGGSFQVRATAPNAKNKYPKVECRFELSCQINVKWGVNYEPFMSTLAEYLNVKLDSKKKNSYFTFTVRTVNLKSNDILIKYLDSFPLFSRNYLDYKDWLKALEIYKKEFVKGRSNDIIKQINIFKDRMRDKRTIFTWDHLQNFYPLNNPTSRKEIGIYDGSLHYTSPFKKNEILERQKSIINENRG